MRTLLYKKRVVPNKFFWHDEVFRITRIKSKYVITEYRIEVTNNGFINKLTINAKHPNSDPVTNEFCLPEWLKGVELNKLLLHTIEGMLSSFHLDSCYFSPLEELKWERL